MSTGKFLYITAQLSGLYRRPDIDNLSDGRELENNQVNVLGQIKDEGDVITGSVYKVDEKRSRGPAEGTRHHTSRGDRRRDMLFS